MRISVIILIGVAFMQVSEASNVTLSELLLGFIPVIIGATFYPLGNRKMMELCGSKLDSFQRTLGMALGSMPIAILLGIYGTATVGLPSASQLGQALLLAGVESTQAGILIFTVLGEVLLLNGSFPQGWSLVGMFIIIAGMIATSLANRNIAPVKPKPAPTLSKSAS